MNAAVIIGLVGATFIGAAKLIPVLVTSYIRLQVFKNVEQPLLKLEVTKQRKRLRESRKEPPSLPQ